RTLSSRSLSALVLHFLEFGIHHIVAAGLPGGAARRPGGLRATAAGGRLGARLSGRVSALRDPGGSLRESLGLLLDHTAVVTLERRAQIRDRGFHLGTLGRV